MRLKPVTQLRIPFSPILNCCYILMLILPRIEFFKLLKEPSAIFFNSRLSMRNTISVDKRIVPETKKKKNYEINFDLIF